MADHPLTFLLRHLRQLAGAGSATERTDRQLLQRFAANGDEDAFALLVRRHGAMVFGVCRRLLSSHDAEDAFQATFVLLAQKAASAHWHESVAGWLHEAAQRVARHARRLAARRHGEERQAAARRAEAVPSPEAEALRRLWLDEELRRLPEKHRTPLVLCHLEGHSHEEASRLLGWPIGTVKGRIARALEQLRRRLRGQGEPWSASGLAVVLTERLPSAVPPETLARTTIHVAVLVACGAPVAETASASVAALLAGAPVGKVKTALALLMLLGILATGGAVAARWLAPESPLPSERVSSPTPPTDRAAPRTDRYGDPLPPGVVARLGTERLMLDQARGLVFSSDGRRLAAHNQAQDLLVWDVPSGKVLFRLRIPSSSSISGRRPLAFSPDGKAIALAYLTHTVRGRMRLATVRIWEVTTGKELHSFDELQGLGFNLAFSPDGRYLFSGGPQAPLLRWDLTGGGAPQEYGKFYSFESLATSRDGKTLTAVTREQGRQTNRTLVRWNAATGKEIGRHTFTTAGGWIAELSSDGRLYAAPHVDGKTIALLDPLTGQEQRQARESDSPEHISISADGTTMTSTNRGGDIGVWDVATGKLRTRFKTPSTSGVCTALSSDGKWLALSGRADSAVHLWDVAAGRELHSFVGHRSGPLTIAFLEDGKEIVTVNRAGRPISHFVTKGADWSFRRWDAATGAERAVMSRNPEGEVWHTSFSADGRRLATVIQDGTLRLWDVESGKELRSWKGPTRETTSTRADGKGGKTVTKNPYPATTAPAFSTDNKTLLAAYGRKIHRWETATGRELPAFEIEEIPQQKFQQITWCLPSPDGRTLAVWSTGIGHLILLDSASGKVKHLLKNIRPWECHPPAFSPDGRTIAVKERGTVSLWEVASGQPRGRMEAPQGTSGLAFSPDGRLLAFGAGPESPLSLWELASGKIVGRLRDDRGGGQLIAFSPDGCRLAVAGYVRPAVFGQAVVTYSPVVLVCDVAELCGKKKVEEIAKTADPSTEELEGLWAELSGADSIHAYRAIRRLGLTGAQGAAFLKARFKGGKLLEERRIARLIAELDDDKFATREKASAELKKLGVRAAPALRRTLEGGVSAEVRLRVRRLLERLDAPQEPPPSPELVRLRIVEALEANGAQEARQALAELSEGATDALLTGEVRASLRRLEKRANKP